MEATQPHCEQSGLPPNWHGVTTVFRSAEITVVVCAKIQSSGDVGGIPQSLICASNMSSFGDAVRRRRSSATHCVRFVGERISAATSPALRGNMLIQSL